MKRKTSEYLHHRGEQQCVSLVSASRLSFITHSLTVTRLSIHPSIPTEYSRSPDNDKLFQLNTVQGRNDLQVPLEVYLCIRYWLVRKLCKQEEKFSKFWMMAWDGHMDVKRKTKTQDECESAQLARCRGGRRGGAGNNASQCFLSFRKHPAVSRRYCAVNAIDRLNRNPRQTA